MRRNKRTEGVVVRSRPVGDQDRQVVILSREGLLEATAYGAQRPSSRLGAAAQVGSRAVFYLYVNPVKGHVKVSDVDRVEVLGAGRLEGLAVFQLWADLVVATHGAGHEAEVYRLLLEGRDALRRAGGVEEVERVLVGWLLRFLGLLGVAPEWDRCARCGRGLGEEGAWWGSVEEGLLCRGCAVGREGAWWLSGAMRGVCAGFAEGRVGLGVRVRMEEGVRRGLVRVVLERGEEAVGRRLASAGLVREVLGVSGGGG
ncbi:DNA repair protein RecO [Spirochaeta thermophila]|nr:DNA repair protein RecO [Spirochaeta thermophila]